MTVEATSTTLPVHVRGSRAAAARRYLAQARTGLAPWDTGRVVPNFVEDRGNPGRWMSEERAAFVDLVQRDVDPDGLFRRGVWPPPPHAPSDRGQEPS